MRSFTATLFIVVAIASAAFGQSRRVAPATTEIEGTGEGSGAAVEERAYNPNANTAAQPERSEGNEDDIDQNEGDDGNSGTGGN